MSVPGRFAAIALVTLAVLSAAGCLDFEDAYDRCVESGECRDEGSPGAEDSGEQDAGFEDGGGTGMDAGADAGTDAGSDAGMDAGTDAGCPVAFCLIERHDFPVTVLDLWSFGPDDVWAVGRDTARHHWNGTEWTTDHDPGSGIALRGVWGTVPGRVWSVGENGNVFERTSTGGWMNHREDAGTIGLQLRAVGGLAADNLWVVGDQGTALHFDGSGWSRAVPADAGVSYQDIWLDPGSNTGWIVGSQGALLELNSGTWNAVSIPATPDFKKVWGAAPNDVYAVAPGAIYHYDGGSWTSIHPVTLAESVWGARSDDVFVGGQSGAMHHFQGLTWTPLALPGLTTTMTVNAIATPSSETLFVAGFDSTPPLNKGYVLRYQRGP